MRLEIRWRSGAYEVVDMEPSKAVIHGRYRERAEARERVRALMFPPAADQVRTEPPLAQSEPEEIKQVEPIAVKTAPPKRKRRVKRSSK